MNKIASKYSLFIAFPIFLSSCNSVPESFTESNEQAKLHPDYSEITIPVNIAPLNFNIEEKGDAYFAKISGKNGDAVEVASKNGTIKIPENKWKKLLEQNINGKLEYTIFIKNEGAWKKYKSFENMVSDSKVDPFLYYRLLGSHGELRFSS